MPGKWVGGTRDLSRLQRCGNQETEKAKAQFGVARANHHPSWTLPDAYSVLCPLIRCDECITIHLSWILGCTACIPDKDQVGLLLSLFN